MMLTFPREPSQGGGGEQARVVWRRRKRERRQSPYRSQHLCLLSPRQRVCLDLLCPFLFLKIRRRLVWLSLLFSAEFRSLPEINTIIVSKDAATKQRYFNFRPSVYYRVAP